MRRARMNTVFLHALVRRFGDLVGDRRLRREAASGWHGETIASLLLFTRLQTYRCAALSDVMGHFQTHAQQQRTTII